MLSIKLSDSVMFIGCRQAVVAELLWLCTMSIFHLKRCSCDSWQVMGPSWQSEHNAHWSVEWWGLRHKLLNSL